MTTPPPGLPEEPAAIAMDRAVLRAHDFADVTKDHTSAQLIKDRIAYIDALRAHAQELAEQLAYEQRENEVLREQNFAMNKTIAESEARERATREDAERYRDALETLLHGRPDAIADWMKRLMKAHAALRAGEKE